MTIWSQKDFLNLLEEKLLNKNFIQKAFIILTLVSLIGCLPARRDELIGPRPTAEEIHVSPALPPEDIDIRISFLEEKLNSPGLEKEKKRIAEDLISGYRSMKKQMQGEISTADEKQISNLLFKNLGQLEREFFTETPALQEQQCPKSMDEFIKKRQNIIDAFFSNDHDGVISECIEMESSLGPDSLTPEIGFIFAISLSKKKMFSEAINVGERIVKEMEGRPGKTELVAGITEWLLEVGNEEKAFEEYEKLLDILDEEGILSTRLQDKLEKKEQEEVTTVKEEKSVANESISEILLSLPEKQWTKDVEELLRNNELDQAKLLLLKSKLRTEDETEIALIDKVLEILDIEDKNKTDQLNARESIDTAITLIEQEKYEEALEILEENSNSHNFTEERKRLEDLVIEKLINRERDRAANIFLTAKNSSDPENKTALFEESFNILLKLIEKYPDSPLVPKLKANLQQVKKEMEKYQP